MKKREKLKKNILNSLINNYLIISKLKRILLLVFDQDIKNQTFSHDDILEIQKFCIDSYVWISYYPFYGHRYRASVWHLKLIFNPFINSDQIWDDRAYFNVNRVFHVRALLGEFLLGWIPSHL